METNSDNVRENSKMKLTQFGEYLLKSHIVGDGKEKYYVNWVRQFFSNKHLTSSTTWHEQLKVFLIHMGKTGRYQDWQIRQADQAVRLYHTNFMREALLQDGVTALQDNSENSTFSVEEALQKFDMEMSVRNYSPRT